MQYVWDSLHCIALASCRNVALIICDHMMHIVSGSNNSLCCSDIGEDISEEGDGSIYRSRLEQGEGVGSPNDGATCESKVQSLSLIKISYALCMRDHYLTIWWLSGYLSTLHAYS